MQERVLLGQEGYRAFCLEGHEDRLPAEHGPWTVLRFVNVPEEMRADLRANGYFIFKPEQSK